MAMYEYITDEGYNLMRRMLTEGCTIDFTRIEMGNGESPESNLRKVTALSNVVVSLDVDSVDVQDDNTISISSIFTNEGLERGFYFREKGIYATDGEKEILFSYANAGPSANYIDPPSVEVIEKKIITHITQLQESTEKINVKVKSGIYVTTDVFQNFQSQNVKDLDKKADKLTEFSMAEQRENILSGDTIDVILGKIQKNLEDLKDVAFSADYKSLKNLPEIPPKVRVKGAAEPQYRTGDVDITPENIGLDSTRDMDKPVSTAALEKFDEYYQQLKSYTDKAINDLINGAPTTLDTLKELATAIQNNKSVIDALNSAIGTKANAAEFDSHTKTVASGTVSGHVKVDTALSSTSSNPVQNAAVKKELDNKVGTTGSASDTTVTFSQASGRTNIASGEKLSTILGKISKFFTDLKNVAFSGSYNDLDNKPTTTNVTQTATANTVNADYRILLSNTADDTTRTEGARKNSGLKFNPSTGTLSATKLVAKTEDSTVAFVSNDTTSPTAWTDVAVLSTNEKHASLFNKVSTMLKNVRWIYKKLGTTDISKIGDGTVTGALSSLNSNLSTKVDSYGVTVIKILNHTISFGTYIYPSITQTQGIAHVSDFEGDGACIPYVYNYNIDAQPGLQVVSTSIRQSDGMIIAQCNAATNGPTHLGFVIIK